MGSEISTRADFSSIRYAQCWEDADVLLQGLEIQPGDSCVSIASAGDNTLAMLAQQPGRVIALDLNPAQLACLALRVAAYRELSHAELLGLLGSRPARDRAALYQRCRPLLSTAERDFWDAHSNAIDGGIGSAGKFERYFALFRNYVLPLIHSRTQVQQLLEKKSATERHSFYEHTWNNWRWRALFRLFFSRAVMGRTARDPSFFRYVQGNVAERILTRARYALTELDTAENPYLHWILTGTHGTALPYALREEHFDTIRTHLDCLEWHLLPLEDFLEREGAQSIDRYNLSDIFEYMSPANYQQLLERLIRAGRRGGRLLYWNMLAERRRPKILARQLQPLDKLATRLQQIDKAFFYSAVVVEELV